MNDYLVGILITPVYPRNKIQFPSLRFKKVLVEEK